MTSRYAIRQVFKNTSQKYANMFKERDVQSIQQFNTPDLRYPTAKEISNLSLQSEVWKSGDRYWKYAAKYYNGRSDLWWVIAWFNKEPTEATLEIGDVILIPTPLENVLEYYGY